MCSSDVSEKTPLTRKFIALNNWKEGIKQDEIRFVPKEKVDGYKATTKTIFDLDDDQFKECSQIFDQLVEDREGSSYKNFASIKEDKSLCGYFLCKNEENGTFSFFCALHSLEYELASQDGEPRIENLDIQDYQERAVMVAVRPHFTSYGITGSKQEVAVQDSWISSLYCLREQFQKWGWKIFFFFLAVLIIGISCVIFIPRLLTSTTTPTTTTTAQATNATTTSTTPP